MSLTVCAPGTSSCQTIDDLLLDTGSSGLRIFTQALTVSLPSATTGSGALGECVQYGDGSSQWGPIRTASVVLGSEPAIDVPIQVIDSTFAALPSACANADLNPAAAGFNGILGVGLFAQDCGTACEQSSSIGIYYACSGSACSGATVPISSQVSNPVSLLAQENNGLVIQLPAVPASGSPSASGYLILGIGTQANNTPSSVKTYTVNALGEFSTTLGGVSYPSFIDTGSNGLFFPAPSASSLPSCPSPDSGWYCPASPVNLSATSMGFNAVSDTVSFEVANFQTLIDSSTNVFSDVGGSIPTLGFDWGLPFHFGRAVYVGIEGRASSLGLGPYFAY